MDVVWALVTIAGVCLIAWGALYWDVRIRRGRDVAPKARDRMERIADRVRGKEGNNKQV